MIKILFTIIFYIVNLSDNKLNAHFRGIFLTEVEAEKRALEIGCKGAHKSKDKWLPCTNEEELHKFLRK